MAANQGTHRPLSIWDRWKLNQAMTHLRSRFHSVRVAAHREIQQILRKYEQNRGRQSRGMPFAPAFRSEPRRRGQRGSFRTTRATASWLRWGAQRAQEPMIKRMERHAGIRDEHGRLIDQDQRGNGRHRAQQSRDHFEGNSRQDNRGQQDQSQRDGDRARDRQDGRSRDDDRVQRETGDGGNRDQRDVPPQREQGSADRDRDATPTHGQAANGREVHLTTDIGPDAWSRPVGDYTYRTEEGYRIDSPVPLTREQIEGARAGGTEAARQQREAAEREQPHDREGRDTAPGSRDTRDEAPADRGNDRPDSHFVGVDRVGMPGEDLSRDNGHDARDALNGGRDGGHDALGAGRSEPAVAGHDSGR